MKQTRSAPEAVPQQAKSEIKILISGPVSAGKTTAVGSVCNDRIVSTEASYTEGVFEDKDTTTVAMDYGLCQCIPGRKIHLYGTPGQQRFDFMWDILGKGMDGIIILINNDLPEPQRILGDFLNIFSALPTVIGVTKMDRVPNPSIGAYRRMLEELAVPRIPVFNIDTRNRHDVTLLIERLLDTLDAKAS